MIPNPNPLLFFLQFGVNNLMAQAGRPQSAPGRKKQSRAERLGLIEPPLLGEFTPIDVHPNKAKHGIVIFFPLVTLMHMHLKKMFLVL